MRPLQSDREKPEVTSEEVFLTQEFLSQARGRLLRKQTDILKRLRSEDEALQKLVSNDVPKDSIDLTVENLDKLTIEMLELQELNALKAIQSALHRLNDGYYGHCMQCGNLIQEQRLTALPEAVLCIRCKQQLERQTRRSS